LNADRAPQLKAVVGPPFFNVDKMMKDSRLKFVALLIIVILFSHAAHAQARDVPVSFREDGLKKELAYRVKLFISGEETEPKYSEKGFIVPSDLKAKRIRVKIAFCDKVIDFGEVDGELFETEWIVGIDNKPYEKSNVGHLPGPMREQGNILYFIEFMSGGFIKYKITVFK
jgi:hypothetical protein